MPEEIDIVVRNQLASEKRDLNIYHHSTKSAYMISHNNNVTIRLGSAEDGDYLHISMVSGPGSPGKDCWIDFPSWCFVTFSGLCNGDVLYKGKRMLMRIPPGPPVWQIRVSIPSYGEMKHKEGAIIISDNEPGNGNGHKE